MTAIMAPSYAELTLRYLSMACRGIGAELDDDRQAGWNRFRARFFLKGANRRERDTSLQRIRINRPETDVSTGQVAINSALCYSIGRHKT